MLPALRTLKGDLHHLRNLVHDTSTSPVTTPLCSPFAIGLAIASFGHATLILTDRGIELFPLLSCCEKLILMASHKDVGLWTCQDDSWLFLWVWKAEDRSVGAIERNERLLFLRDA